METVLRTIKRFIPRPAFDALAPFYHFLLALAAASYYGFPGRGLVIIGVTGTNGKTTVVHILHEVFLAAGQRVGSVSSLRFKIGGAEEPNLLKMTMPGRFRLQRFLRQAKNAGCRFAVVEVTSQGILQSRHRFIPFSAAVLTNVRPEHIEAHGGFEPYRAAKMKIFEALPAAGFAVLNRDDPSSEYFAKSTRADIFWFGTDGIEAGGATYPARLLKADSRAVLFEVGTAVFELPIGGRFNFENALAAVAAARAFGIPDPAIRDGLKKTNGIPGRLEEIQSSPFRVVVDYAVTPDALRAVYETFAPETSNSGNRASNLICVFGSAGGGRDRWKRPELGRIASEFCKKVILTSDDPEDEDPARIAEDIQAGFTKSVPSAIITDRRLAIRQALSEARSGDTVVLTGMGAQPWLAARGGKIVWDERRVAREELERLKRT